MNIQTCFFVICLLIFGKTGYSQSGNYWQATPSVPVYLQKNRELLPNREQIYRLALPQLSNQLKNAPLEFGSDNTEPVSVLFPLPSRGLVAFNVVYSPIMEAALAAKYAPFIQTYKIYNPKNTAEQGRIDLTPQGFHAIIFTDSGTVYIDPYHQDSREFYSLYYKQDYVLPKNKHFQEQIIGLHSHTPEAAPLSPQAFGGTLRIYRLALACTQEYSAFHGNTKMLVLSAIVTSINRINSIYEKELSIRLNLVNKNDTLIFLSPGSDPYSNNNGSSMLGQNQATIDARIGSVNYDIGHVYSTGGGGVAILGSVCVNGLKARGVTGAAQPINDPFDVDYVAHEIGHQFGANHTFNGNTGSCGGNNRNSSTAYEPGSGSTIMAYAGICSPNNIQPRSNDYFHLASLEEIRANITSDPSASCAQTQPTANVPPTAFAGSDYTIPARTPFMLGGAGSDANADVLSYCWEQYDLGAASGINLAVGAGPLFRSLAPSASGVRVLPRLPVLLTGMSIGSGEMLPVGGRQMRFGLTVRDNSTLAGAYHSDQITITALESAGPFAVPTPANTLWTKGTWQPVKWNPAGTNRLPIDCKRVCILYSKSNNQAFEDTLLASVPNTGAAMVWLPDSLPSLQTRIMVRGKDNIFFNISPAPIQLSAAQTPGFSLHTLADTVYTCGQTAVLHTIYVGRQAGFGAAIALTLGSGLPSGLNILGLYNFVGPADSLKLTINTQNLASGFYGATVLGQSGSVGGQVSFVVAVLPTPNAEPVLSLPAAAALGISQNPNFAWQAFAGLDYEFQISTDSSFTTVLYQTNVGLPTLSLPFSLNVFTKYFWRVRTGNVCGLGAWSVVRAFRTLMPAPLGPFNASALAGSVSEIAVSWTDFATDETGFVVEQAGSTTSFWPADTLLPNTVSWTAKNLLAGTIYRFRVRAFNQGGYSAYSNIAFDTTFRPTYSAKTPQNEREIIINQQNNYLYISLETKYNFANNTNGIRAMLYEATGRLVASTGQFLNNQNNLSLNVGHLPAGVYMVCVWSGASRQIKRVFIR